MAADGSDDLFRLAFASAPIGNAIVGLDGRWHEVNRSLSALLGYPERELLTMTFGDITHPDDVGKDIDALARLVAGEISTYQVEKRYVTASGAVVWVLLSVTVARDVAERPRYFVSQMLDITDRRRHADQLRDLVAMLSHDLRTPATTIAGMADLLLDADECGVEEHAAFARRIGVAAHSMHALLEDTLTVSTLDADAVAARPQSVEVDAMVAEVVAEVVAGLAPSATVRLRPSAAGARAWIDPQHLERVLANLVGNAQKYGGTTITVSTGADGAPVAAAPSTGSVWVSVSDDGPGVPDDFVPRLYDRFSRSDSARLGPRRGTGLGLHIVKTLLELNGAGIAYAHAPGGGACFTVSMPEATRPGPRT